MRRLFGIFVTALAMVAVALVSAFITMRLAIHGREAVVPSIAGLTVADATKLARHQGLGLNLENRFYSTDVAAGHILAQDPAPGSRVRRDWPIRITESLGPQSVNVPNLTGNSERAATVSIRRLSLDLGAVARLAVPGDSDVVLTQTPPPNSAGVDGPRVSLLVSDPEDAEPPAYVMPSLIGLTYAEANERAEIVGLHLVAMAPVAASQAATDAAGSAAPGAAPIVRVNPATGAVSTATPGPSAASASAQPASVASSVAVDVSPFAEVAHPTGTVTWQTPGPGHRVIQGQAVHVSFGQPEQASAASPQAQ